MIFVDSKWFRLLGVDRDKLVFKCCKCGNRVRRSKLDVGIGILKCCKCDNRCGIEFIGRDTVVDVDMFSYNEYLKRKKDIANEIEKNS